MPKTLLNISSTDRIQGTTTNFKVNLGNNGRLHNLKSLSLESLEINNSFYNVDDDWMLKFGFIHNPESPNSRIFFNSIYENTLNSSINFTFRPDAIGGTHTATVYITVNQGYTDPELLTEIKNKINTYLNTHYGTTNVVYTDYNIFSGSGINTVYNFYGVASGSLLNFIHIDASLTIHMRDLENNPISSRFKMAAVKHYYTSGQTTYEQLQKLEPYYINISNNRKIIIIYDREEFKGDVFPNGFYSMSLLTTKLNTTINGKFVEAGHPSNTLVYSYDTTTLLSSLSVALAYQNLSSIVFINNLASRNLGVETFEPNIIPFIFDAISGTRLIEMNSYETLYLHCPELPSISIDSKGRFNSVICKIPIGMAQFGYNLFYRNTSDTLLTFDERGMSDLSVLTFFITDNEGNQVNNNGLDWTMSFVMET